MSISVNEARITIAALAGESIAFFICDTCGWVDEFELSTGLPPACPRCDERGSLIVQEI